MIRKLLSALAIVVISASTMGVTAQDIKVVSVGSVSQEKAKTKQKTVIPGGDTPDSYTKVDDGAYDCIYKYTVKVTTKSGEEVMEDYYCNLDLGNKAARFCDLNAFRADSAVLAPNPDAAKREELRKEYRRSKYRFTGDVILGYPEGKLTYTDLVTPDYMEYTESLGTMEWTIGEETDTVCGYLCTKATTNYGGREWTAWFAEDIPSAFGPWKFNGLPGLILKATDSEGVNDFTAISFKAATIPVAKPHNEAIQQTSRDNFVKSKNLFESNPYKYLSPEMVKEITVIEGGVIVNGVEVPTRPHGYTPIERQ